MQTIDGYGLTVNPTTVLAKASIVVRYAAVVVLHRGHTRGLPMMERP